jgi:uncharacterized protein YybS (DUF2232 family)
MAAPFFGVLVACCSAGLEGLAIGVGMDEVGADVATEIMLGLLCVGLDMTVPVGPGTTVIVRVICAWMTGAVTATITAYFFIHIHEIFIVVLLILYFLNEDCIRCILQRHHGRIS